MTHWKYTLLSVMFFISTCSLVFYGLYQKQEAELTTQTTPKVDRDSIYRLNLEISVKTQKLKKTSDSLAILIDKNDKGIQLLKKLQDAQKTHLDSATTDQLLELFSKVNPSYKTN